MTIINLTPHPIVIRAVGGADTVIAPDPAGPARISSTTGQDVTPSGCPVPVFSAPVWGAVTGLPAPEDGVLLVVSSLVAARCPDRDDVVSPGTGPADGAIRDESGRIVAVTRLVRASGVSS